MRDTFSVPSVIVSGFLCILAFMKRPLLNKNDLRPPVNQLYFIKPSRKQLREARELKELNEMVGTVKEKKTARMLFNFRCLSNTEQVEKLERMINNRQNITH